MTLHPRSQPKVAVKRRRAFSGPSFAIQVTSARIKRYVGVVDRTDPAHNPIATAIYELVAQCSSARVCLRSSSARGNAIHLEHHGFRVEAEAPADVFARLLRWQASGEMEPFNFTLQLRNDWPWHGQSDEPSL